MSTERLFEPFAGWLIRPEWAARVIAGAYDAKSPAERREIVSTTVQLPGRDRSAEDLAPGDDADEVDLLRREADTLTTILDAEAFRRPTTLPSSPTASPTRATPSCTSGHSPSMHSTTAVS